MMANEPYYQRFLVAPRPGRKARAVRAGLARRWRGSIAAAHDKQTHAHDRQRKQIERALPAPALCIA